MNVDLRARQAGTLFSMGVEDEPSPAPGRRRPSGQPRGMRRLWGRLRRIVDAKGVDVLVARSQAPLP